MTLKLVCLAALAALATSLCLANEMASAEISVDTKTPHTCISLQSGSGISYSTSWGSVPGASLTITADGYAGATSASIQDYDVFSLNTAGSGSYAWNYASVPEANLPRDGYELTHTIYDSDNAAIDTVKCSVRLLPEPACLGALLLALAACARKLA